MCDLMVSPERNTDSQRLDRPRVVDELHRLDLG
jgi:hypothetical protein